MTSQHPEGDRFAEPNKISGFQEGLPGTPHYEKAVPRTPYDELVFQIEGRASKFEYGYMASVLDLAANVPRRFKEDAANFAKTIAFFTQPADDLSEEQKTRRTQRIAALTGARIPTDELGVLTFGENEDLKPSDLSWVKMPVNDRTYFVHQLGRGVRGFLVVSSVPGRFDYSYRERVFVAGDIDTLKQQLAEDQISP